MNNVYQIQNNFISKIFTNVDLTAAEKVYLETIQTQLHATLKRTYVNIETYIDEKKFREATNQFLLNYPPTSSSYLGYGREFPNFIERYSSNFPPFIKDIALFDWTYSRSIREILPNFPQFLLPILDNISTIDFTDFTFQPSFRMQEFTYSIPNLLSQYEILCEEEDKYLLETARNSITYPVYLIFFRVDCKIKIYLINKKNYLFLSLLQKKRTFKDALMQIKNKYSSFSPLKILNFCLSQGFFQFKNSSRFIIDHLKIC